MTAAPRSRYGKNVAITFSGLAALLALGCDVGGPLPAPGSGANAPGQNGAAAGSGGTSMQGGAGGAVDGPAGPGGQGGGDERIGGGPLGGGAGDVAGAGGTWSSGGGYEPGGGPTGGDPNVDASPDAPVVGDTCPALPFADPSIKLSTTTTPGCRCTRRPGPDQSFECAVGANQFAAAEIGPQGGTLELTGRQGKSSGVAFQLVIPPGALSEMTRIQVTETSVPPPQPLVDYSPVYLVEPRGLKLAKLAQVRVPWGSTSGYVHEGLSIYERTEDAMCAFAPLGDNYGNAGFNQGSIAHLGYLVVGAQRTAAEQMCP